MKKNDYKDVLKDMSIDSQVRLILEHLIRRGSITAMEAVEEYGCYRLSARIADLREAGVEMENSHNRGHHAKYVLDR